MKYLILSLLFSISAYSNCVDTYNKGLIKYQLGSEYFELAVVEYNLAIEEAGKGNPNREIICNNLLNAYSGFYVAVRSYSSCRELFAEAVKVCTGGDKLQAMKASNLCSDNASVSTENKNFMKSNAANYCTNSEIEEAIEAL